MFDFIVTKTSETRKKFAAGNFTWIFSVSADPPTCNWKTIFGPFPTEALMAAVEAGAGGAAAEGKSETRQSEATPR